MKWNNGAEQKKFEREQEKLRKQYLAAGMTEEQIQAMYEFDKNNMNLRQREARHTQNLDIEAFDDDGDDEAKNPLLKKFIDNFSCTDKHFEGERYDWIEEIENEELYKAIKSLSQEDLDLITMLAFDGYKQNEIAKKKGVVSVVICKKIKRLKKYLKLFLKDG